MATKRIKHLGVNKGCEGHENYQTLSKDIEDDTKKWKGVLC